MAVSYVANGTWQEFTTDGTYTLPTGFDQEGDLFVLTIVYKPYNTGWTLPSGWELIGGRADGTVAAGNGTGSVQVRHWMQRRGASAISNPLLDASGATLAAAVVHIFRSSDPTDDWDVNMVSAAITNWTTSSQTVNADTAIDLPAGSAVLATAGIRDDSATFTRPVNAINVSDGSGGFAAAHVEAPGTHFSTTTGNDLSADTAYRLFGATPATGKTLIQTATISAAETGTATWLVIQAVDPTLFDQVGFRARNDDGSESAATWKAAANTNWSQPSGEIFRLRFLLDKISGSSALQDTLSYQYQYASDGVNFGSWTGINASSSVAKTSPSSHFASGNATTDQLGGTGTFRAGTMLEAPNSGVSGSTAIAAGEHTEHEVALSLTSGDVVDGGKVRFRIVASGSNPFSINYTLVPELTIGAGGTLFTATASDTVTTVTESVSRVFTAIRTSADTTSVTDSVARIANKIRTVADTITTVTESVIRVLVYPRTASDTVTTSDSLVRQAITFARTTSESLTTSDTIARINNKIRTVSDSITAITESVVRVMIKPRTASDTVTTVTDSVARIANKIRTATDTTAVTDTVARVANKIRTAVDTVTTVTESVVRDAFLKLRTATDTTAVTDSVTRIANKIRTLADTTSVTDSVARVANKVRIATDTVTTVTDSLVRNAIGFVRTATDTVVTSDTVSRFANMGRAISDTTIVNDTVARGLVMLRSAGDTITTITDSVVGIVNGGMVQLYRTASDTVAIGADTVGRTVSFVRTLADTVVTTDAVSRVVSFARAVSDSVTTSDAVGRVLTVLRSASDTTSVTDSVARAGLALMRTATDTVASVSDATVRMVGRIRTATDTLVVSDVVTRSWNGARQAVDNVSGVTDSIFSVVGVFLMRTASDSVAGITDSVVRIGQFSRSAAETVVTSDFIGRLATYARTATDSLPAITDAVVRGGVLVRRSVEDSVAGVTDFVVLLLGIPKSVVEFVRVKSGGRAFRVGGDPMGRGHTAGVNRMNVGGGNDNREKVD
jgi:hypothetical protein